MEAAEEEAVAVAEGEEAVEVERNCYPMYKPFCNLCTFLTPLMILEESVATGAVNDFLRMMIPSQPAIYSPLYNLSLKEFYTFFSFFPFFHSLIYVPTNHSLVPLPSFQPNKQDKTKTKQNQKQPKTSPSPSTHTPEPAAHSSHNSPSPLPHHISSPTHSRHSKISNHNLRHSLPYKRIFHPRDTDMRE